MAAIPPRAVFVTRESDYHALIAAHATRDQARFFLERRGQQLEDLQRRDEQLRAALHAARSAVPADWRQAEVSRPDLDRFLFGRDDVVVTVGPDGLVANVAKYLDGQPVLGVNPSPDLYDGVLARVALARLAALLPACAESDAPVEARTMVEARLDTGERLLALNEIFVGHRSHQTARYRLQIGATREDQASSGLIVASGTGATGWARSIAATTGSDLAIGPTDRAVGYLVREPFPSVSTGTALRAGRLTSEPLHVRSRMNEGGVIFADGIEQDFIGFGWGREVSVGPAARVLNLVAG